MQAFQLHTVNVGKTWKLDGKPPVIDSSSVLYPAWPRDLLCSTMSTADGYPSLSITLEVIQQTLPELSGRSPAVDEGITNVSYTVWPMDFLCVWVHPLLGVFSFSLLPWLLHIKHWKHWLESPEVSVQLTSNALPDLETSQKRLLLVAFSLTAPLQMVA